MPLPRVILFRGFLLSLFFSFCVNSCASGRKVEVDFYRGLKNSSNSAAYFKKALESSNAYIRQAASEKLAAFDIIAKNGQADKKKALAFLLNFQNETDSNEARLYVLKEYAKHAKQHAKREEEFFSETELAAIEGHFASSLSRFGEALGFFREFQEDEEWPAQIPALFLEYPVLINDLGRAFQYTSSGEGIELFLQWEKNLNAPDLSAARYGLLFFSARIARRLGRQERGISLFEQALPLAPDAEQADACSWYILDLSANGQRDIFIQRLERLVPYWHDDAYFDDILERVLQELVSKREWENLLRVFNLIQNCRADSTAGFAWIIARAIEEGYLNGEELQPASVYMCIAYNARDMSFYYRSQSAASLGVPVLELSAKDTATSGKPSQLMQFLSGFFDYNAVEFAMPYIRLFEKELSSAELRSLAEAFGKAGMYAQSIRVVSMYIKREGYTCERQDMELLFPRPYRELIEKHAAEYDMSPALLYALVRTESAFQSGIVSSAGAVGLTQLMPATAQEMAGRIRREGGPDYAAGELNLTDPDLSVHIGTYYLNYLMERFDDTLLAILAYNGGMNRVRRWRAASALPADIFLETVTVAETRLYGKKVMAAAAVYEELYYQQR